jgi:hypothetical protein
MLLLASPCVSLSKFMFAKVDVYNKKFKKQWQTKIYLEITIPSSSIKVMQCLCCWISCGKIQMNVVT